MTLGQTVHIGVGAEWIKQLGESKTDSKEANDCQKYVNHVPNSLLQRRIVADCFRRQVACADVILLNKTDLVSPEHLEEVERRIRSVPFSVSLSNYEP